MGKEDAVILVFRIPLKGYYILGNIKDNSQLPEHHIFK
jgi:hypothetical protein